MKVIAVTKNSSQFKYLVPLHSRGCEIKYRLSGITMDARRVRQPVEILQTSNTDFETLSFMPFRFNSKKEKNILP